MFLQDNYSNVVCVAVSDLDERVDNLMKLYVFACYCAGISVLHLIFLFFPRYSITKGAVYSGNRR